jgi:phospholipid/cholesterol/gamma-HCH transport system substrate-binding protein
VELGYKEEVGVGALVILGVVVFTIGMFWLTGHSLLSKGVMVDIAFKSVSGLKEGDPVRVSGVHKGRVNAVRLEHVGRVIVQVQLASDMQPHEGAKATVAAADFLGAMFVDYDPGPATGPLLPPGQAIEGATEEQLADVAARAATSANELITGVNAGLKPGQLAQDIHNTLVVTQRGMKALTEVSNGPMIQQTTATLKVLEGTLARFDSIMGRRGAVATGNRLDTLSANLTKLTQHLSEATKSLSDVLAAMNRGEGTLGRLKTDTLLYRNLNTTLESLSELLKDLKERPGRYLTVKVF